ncbi:MAG TPA: DUF1015 domain-containing protein [Gaiellales bacterium]|jgi:uncharacterized protein (DUF1015 family)|nr:DUF1015 domain-containing protein [Gaiellales bacterium]
MASTPATRSALEPLRALRYNPEFVELGDVVAPPYDVISAADRDAYMRRSPHSIVHLLLPDGVSQAGKLLGDWRREGALLRDTEPSVWWHTQTYLGPDGGEVERSGFLSAVRLAPYSEGRVRPHERTHARTREGRLELIRAVKANLSPVFGLYDDPEGGPREALLPHVSGPPVMETTDSDGTVHRFWQVSDPGAIGAVQEAMAERTILIADGHHRYETALAYRDEVRAREGDPPGDLPADFVLMHLVNMHGEGLVVYPTHRVVPGKRDVTPDLLSHFAVRELEATPVDVERELNTIPPDTIAFAVWHGAHRPALLCTLRDRAAVSMAMHGIPTAVKKVDAAVLEAAILQPMLGLLDAEQFAASDAVQYVRELGAATAPVERGEAAAAFILRAPTVEQVRAVADAGAVMPQKSTYFFPKLWSGFLVNPLEP